MRTKYFTFGKTHIHIIDGLTFDKDCVVEITAVDPRDTMFKLFGGKWGFSYGEKPDMSYYPRGIIKLQ